MTTIKDNCYLGNNTTLVCNYIPNNISKQYEHVRIIDFKRKDKIISVSHSSFIHESWAKVQTLEFSDKSGLSYFPCTFYRGCFKGLISLKELRIHISMFQLDTSSFVGLPSVHTLDVSKCYRLTVGDVIEAVTAHGALPAIQNLIMSEIGTLKSESNYINQAAAESLSKRNITSMDISRTQIKYVNVTALLKSLTTVNHFNLSYLVLGGIWAYDLTQKDLLNLRIVDLSYSVLPAKVIPFLPGKVIIANKTVEMNGDMKMKNIFTPMIINVSGIVRAIASIWIYNSTGIIHEHLGWKTTHLIMRNNNFKYLDILIKCPVFKFTSLIHLDLSDNGLEMIRPTVCMPNLETVILSNNGLFKMLNERPRLFEKLFASQTKLREINLSNNRLSEVPHNMFKYNKNIETIDLSFNHFEQLHFDLTGLHHLALLDVSHNNIKVLDEVSINSLNGIKYAMPLVSAVRHCIVVFTSNPIKCSTCACKPFIHWLVSSEQVNAKQQNLVCVAEDKTVLNVDDSAIKRVQNICDRRIVYVACTISASFIMVTVSLASWSLYRRKRRLQRKRNMEAVISRFITGEEQYEFVVFLSYSSRDEEFVQDHVIDPLNENLKLMIGTDRNLICTGDQHLRPGFRVLDETIKCLDRASVIIVVASNNFCRSSYCQNEFDQAYIQRKPIVLMLLGEVDEELMAPSMKQLYRRNVRILWKVENGQYVLKSTWENICSSVLEKVQV